MIIEFQGQTKLKAATELAIYLLDALPASHRDKILDHYDDDSSKIAAAMDKGENLVKEPDHAAQSKQVATSNSITYTPDQLTEEQISYHIH